MTSSTISSTGQLDEAVQSELPPAVAKIVTGYFDQLDAIRAQQKREAVDHARKIQRAKIDAAVAKALDYPRVRSECADAPPSRWTTIVHDHMQDKPFGSLPANFKRLYKLKRCPTWKTVHASLVRLGLVP